MTRLSVLLAFAATIAAAQSAPVSIIATRVSDQPILSPAPATFYSAGIFNPAATMVPDQKIFLLIRGQNEKGVSQIGSASSIGSSAKNFSADAVPAVAPQQPYEVGGGVEDPRIVKIRDTYYLTYTAYNGKDAQLCLATSHDARHWQRHGVILPAYKGTWNQQWTKSGAIVPQKINGKWWMYYLGTRRLPRGEIADDRGGETVDYMGLAVSTDLMHWKDATAEPVLGRRRDAFDSRVMEPGPPPIITPAGILLLYNGADAHLVYRTGWALFDLRDPSKLLARSDQPFFQPELPWEKIGQVPNVVFLEGLIPGEGVNPGVAHSDSRGAACSPLGFNLIGFYGAADKYIGAVKLHVHLVCGAK